MGHATRSKAVIEELQKNHDLLIACGGRAYDYISGNFDNVISIQKLGIGYKKNKVSDFATLVYNLKNLPLHFKSLKRLITLVKKFKPEIIINDFEYMTTYSC